MTEWESESACKQERTIQGFKYQPCVYGQRQNDEQRIMALDFVFRCSQMNSICCCFSFLFANFFLACFVLQFFFYFGHAAASRTFGWFTFYFSQMIKFYSKICLFVSVTVCVPISILLVFFRFLFFVCTIIKPLFKFCIVFNRVLLAKFGFIFWFVSACDHTQNKQQRTPNFVRL